MNEIASVQTLLSEWSAASSDGRKQFKVSAAGNINFAGELRGKYAEIFFPVDQLFESSIEPGVRPLVLAVVRAADLVTYTSCEGHRYDDEGASSECHIGVLPRTRAELRTIWRALRLSKQRCDNSLRASIARLYPWHLLDRANNRNVPVIDLYLHKRDDTSEAEYFKHRSSDAAQFASVLRELLGMRANLS